MHPSFFMDKRYDLGFTTHGLLLGGAVSNHVPPSTHKKAKVVLWGDEPSNLHEEKSQAGRCYRNKMRNERARRLAWQHVTKH